MAGESWEETKEGSWVGVAGTSGEGVAETSEDGAVGASSGAVAAIGEVNIA
jgi:hypothetical protein